MAAPDTQERVRGFVQAHFPDIPLEEIVFFKHPNIAGLDVELFMHEFADAFGVNMDGFHGPRYAMDETHLTNFPKMIFHALFTRDANASHTFDVAHLVAVAIQGSWFDP